MPAINKSYFALLGLLSIKPMSAYELVKFSKESIGLFWNESYGHTHKSLKELEKKEAIMLVEDHPSGRRQKVYDITVAGKRMLKEWLSERPDEVVFRNELLLKVFLADKQHIKDLLSYIEAEEASCQEMLGIIQGIEVTMQHVVNQQGAKSSQRELWLLTIDYGHRYLNMTIEWCKHAREVLERI